MNLIYKQLENIKNEHRLGIMTHIVLGYPTLKDSIELVKMMAEVGVDFIELQIPFSDPLGDGPTIMKANHAALRGGMTVDKAFEAMMELSRDVGAIHELPLLFMTYYQIVFRRGVKKFCEDAARAGASGLIIPDVPVDEESYDHFFAEAKSAGLVAMKFLSMVSTESRVRKVLEDGDFLYLFGQKGTTGARSTLHEDLEKNFKRIKAVKDVPTAVGFGISNPEHIKELKQIGADVAIIGSAVLNIYNEAPEGEGVHAVQGYLETLVDAAKSCQIK